MKKAFKYLIDKITDIVIYFKSHIEFINSYAANKKNNKKIGIGLMCFAVSIFTIDILINNQSLLWLVALYVLLLILALITLITLNIQKREANEKNNNRTKKVLANFNFDFNKPVLSYFYREFTKFEFINEDEIQFEEFYKVLTEDFTDNELYINFKTTQPELKYILDKFKKLKVGLTLPDFERSRKILRKSNSFKSKALHNKSNRNPAKKEFRNKIDSIFEKFGV